MSENGDGTSTEPGPVWVKIGRAPGNIVTLEMAERVFALMQEDAPAVLGKYLARAYTGVNPRGGQGGL